MLVDLQVSRSLAESNLYRLHSRLYIALPDVKTRCASSSVVQSQGSQTAYGSSTTADLSDSFEIAEIVNLSALSLSSSSFEPVAGPTDLPAELLHLITGHLWSEPKSRNWLNWFDGFEDDPPGPISASAQAAPKKNARQRFCVMRKNVLAVSSYCKSLRMVVLQESILQSVRIRAQFNDLQTITALSKEFRSCIR